MEFLAVILLAAIIAIVVLPFVAMAKAAKAERLANELRSQMDRLEREISVLRAGPAAGVPMRPAQEPPLMPESKPLPSLPRVVLPAKPAPAAAPQQPAPVPRRPVAEHDASAAKEPPAEANRPASPVNWEEFMGAKLFAWIGGLALFLGIAFFVKYSFDHNLIPPELRVAIGFAAGLGLLAGGMLMKRKENAVTAQTLCATGIVVLYAVTFACRSYYHFPFFGVVTTFFIMSLVTLAAFLLAVRMNALAACRT